MRLLLLDIFAWLFFHLTISLGLIKLPDRYFMPAHKLDALFKERSFEADGKYWRNRFDVHKWKDKLPDGASLFHAGYKKKKMPKKDSQTIGTFIKETKRAELTHWLLMIPAPFFFLWNPVWAGWVMILYALCVNVPFIIIQRYNRIRLTRIKKRKSEERLTKSKQTGMMEEKLIKGDDKMTVFKIDKDLTIHSVDLNVVDLKKMTAYYKDNIGLSVLEKSDDYTSLGIKADNQVLVNLIKTKAEQLESKKAGLFHTAFLVPTRKDLGNVLFALLKKEVPIEGASDHGYSEALYLTDPEGNGIEIYRDKPKDVWDILEDGTIRGVTEQMDAEGVLASRDEQLVEEMPAGTSIGHVHLSVGQLEESQRFYTETLGMQLKYEFGRQARFVASGDYHHHIGLNTWMGENIPARDQYDPGLTRFTLSVSSTNDLAILKDHLMSSNVKIADEAETFLTVTDPNGIRVTITTAE